MAAIVQHNQARDGVVRERCQLRLERSPQIFEDLAQLAHRLRRAEHETASRTARDKVQRERVVERASLRAAAQLFQPRRQVTADRRAQRGDRIEPLERSEVLARVGELYREALALATPTFMRGLVELDIGPFEFLKAYLKRLEAARVPARDRAFERGPS